MKKYLLTFVVFLSLIFSQQPSAWRVYIAPYIANGQYIRANNTTTGIPMAWWKKHLTYNFDADVPHIVKVGFNHAIGSTTSWGNEKSVTGAKLYNFISTENENLTKLYLTTFYIDNGVLIKACDGLYYFSFFKNNFKIININTKKVEYPNLQQEEYEIKQIVIKETKI